VDEEAKVNLAKRLRLRLRSFAVDGFRALSPRSLQRSEPCLHSGQARSAFTVTLWAGRRYAAFKLADMEEWLEAGSGHDWTQDVLLWSGLIEIIDRELDRRTEARRGYIIAIVAAVATALATEVVRIRCGAPPQIAPAPPPSGVTL
jgi:hypothetical protein